MDQELQSLLTMLYGNKQLNEKQLAGIVASWNANINGYRDNMKNAALNKAKQQTPINVESSTIQAMKSKPVLTSIQHDAESLKPIEPKRAANDMSAVDDFKQAFRQARQGGHKTFFWKKTKANPSGMFSTKLNSDYEDVGDETLDVPITPVTIDQSKVNIPSWGKKLSNIVIPEITGRQPLNNTYSYGYGRDLWSKKYANGGTINMEQQVTQLVQAAASGDQKATQQIEQIMQAAQQGDQQALQIAQIIQKVIETMKQQSGVKAKLGAKLDYIQKLKGICPEGTEKVYLKEGGCMCKQKAAEGAKVKKEEKKMNEVQKFKAARPGGTLDEEKKTSMPTKYDEKKHEKLAIGEAMGKNTKAQQDSLKTYRNLFNKQSDQTKYNMGDQKAGLKLKNKKACGGLMKKKNK